MEGKNVLLAIIFSSIVLVVWATFFEAPVIKQQQDSKQIEKKQNLSSPSIDENDKEIKNETTRSDMLKTTNRITIENTNIKGSISLQGAVIDDIVFKNYKETLNSENKVTFLNPKNSV